jgi:mono/diheme cytochrome c family protein
MSARFFPACCSLLLVAAAWAGAADPADGLEARFRQLDANHDGQLTRAEAGPAPWFDRLDRRGTGIITLADIRALARGLARDRADPLAAPAPAATAPDPAPAAVDSPRQGPVVVKPAERGVGRLVPDLAFTDFAGRPGRLSDHRSAPALVIALTSTTCPVTMKYTPSLARLEQAFAAQGVAFLFVNPTATDPPADIRAALQAHALAGRYVHDRDGRLASALEARSTAEVFVLDAARTLVYRGALDDQYGLGYALDAPRVSYVRDALAAVLAGQAPAIAATDAPGCALDFSGTPGASPAPAVTYHNRISRLLQTNCLECHRDGGVAPFSLATYEDVRAHAGMMRKQVARGAMPPWFAAPPAPGESSHWKNDRSLAPADRADLVAWLAGEKPVGHPADAPLPRVFPAGWLIGPPDAVLEFPRAVAIKADGVMPYQTIRVATNFTADTWIRGYEIRPTARAVVHHVIVRVHPPGEPGRGGRNSGADERDGFFAAYVPGNTHAIFPAGFAKKIPAGSTLSFQMHYTPNGLATTDRTSIGLLFASAPPQHVIQVAGLANPRLLIPAGAAHHPETAALTLPATVTLLSLLPHMHVRGKAARYEAVLPDGTRRVLLDVPAYDFNWQLAYQFAEPPTLPRGTRLVYTAWYDNSAGNPANPDPTKTVRWGPQTFDEMMLGYVEYFIPDPKRFSLTGPVPTPAR